MPPPASASPSLPGGGLAGPERPLLSPRQPPAPQTYCAFQVSPPPLVRPAGPATSKMAAWRPGGRGRPSAPCARAPASLSRPRPGPPGPQLRVPAAPAAPRPPLPAEAPEPRAEHTHTARPQLPSSPHAAAARGRRAGRGPGRRGGRRGGRLASATLPGPGTGPPNGAPRAVPAEDPREPGG